MRKSKTFASTATLKAKSIESLGAPVEVRRHPGARRLTLRVSRTRRAVIVTLPVQCDIDEVGTFINRNLDWVRARLDSLPDVVSFRSGAFVPLRGEAHRVIFTRRVSGRGTSAVGAVSRVNANDYPELHVNGLQEHAPRRLMDWLWSEAHHDLEIAVTRYASRLKLKAKRIAIRDQASRWGSCSTTGVLSFSWRLVLAPPSVLNYVAAHEVAHLKEMNHGPGFWALCRELDPNMDEARRWLQIYGMDLHRYAG